MLAYSDALWRHKQVVSFLIHIVRNQFVPSCVILLFAATWMTWTGVTMLELIHIKYNSSQINSSKLMPVWSCQFFYVFCFWYYTVSLTNEGITQQ